jgi:RNA polymerase sigma-70 factor, ECF subfamily
LATGLSASRLPADPTADVALLARIVDRDATALAELYDRHARVLFGLLLRMLSDHSEAEEILQDVFVHVWARAGTYNVSLGSPLVWCVGLARRRAIDRLRARSARPKAVEGVPAPRAVTTPEGHAGEQRRIAIRALDCLPASQREVIEHAYFLGLTHSELAERLSLPVETVKTRIQQGMMGLRQQLHQRDGMR